MHLAAAVGTPTVAIFGPSDHARYSPKGERHAIVRKDIECSPCRKAQCPLGTHACMQDLAVEDVWRMVKRTLSEAVKYGP
jgi:heptosyltransferase II